MPDAMLSVSAVIPTRDRPTAVVGAVESALAQTYRWLDVWVVDDGSIPALVLPPTLIAEERVHLIRVDVSVGPSAARNLAVERSQSDLLAFLDDDDVWLPDKTARQVAVLAAAGDDVAAVAAGFDLVAGSRLVRRHLPPPGRDLPKEMLRRPCLVPSTVIMRRAAFDQLGGFRVDLPRTEDWELWLRLVDRFGLATMPEVLTRRQQSNIAPDVLLHEYLDMVGLLRPRIAALDAAERAATEAWHLMVEGVHRAQAQQPREARRLLWRAWRTDRRAIRPLVQLGRTYLGERRWRAVTGWIRNVPGSHRR